MPREGHGALNEIERNVLSHMAGVRGRYNACSNWLLLKPVCAVIPTGIRGFVKA